VPLFLSKALYLGVWFEKMTKSGKRDLKPAEKFNFVDESGDWVVVDLGDILIHIMTSEYRVKYDIESFLDSLKDGMDGEV
jgi:ribosome-associated protein